LAAPRKRGDGGNQGTGGRTNQKPTVIGRGARVHYIPQVFFRGFVNFRTCFGHKLRAFALGVGVNRTKGARETGTTQLGCRSTASTKQSYGKAVVIYACPSVPTDGVYCTAGYYFLQTASIVFLQDSMLILSIPSAGVPAYHASARTLRTTLAAILRLAGR